MIAVIYLGCDIHGVGDFNAHHTEWLNSGLPIDQYDVDALGIPAVSGSNCLVSE